MFYKGKFPPSGKLFQAIQPDSRTCPRTCREFRRFDDIKCPDIRIQAEADYFTDKAGEDRVKCVFSNAILMPGEARPILPAFGRYFYEPIQLPLTTFVSRILGRTGNSSPVILISSRLSGLPSDILRALIAHEVGHHCSREKIAQIQMEYRIRAAIIPALALMILMTAMLVSELAGTALIGSITLSTVVLGLLWLRFDHIPSTRHALERQRQHWEFLADRHAMRLYGRDRYISAMATLREIELTPEQLSYATIADTLERTTSRAIRTQTLHFRLWKTWRKLMWSRKTTNNK